MSSDTLGLISNTWLKLIMEHGIDNPTAELACWMASVQVDTAKHQTSVKLESLKHIQKEVKKGTPEFMRDEELLIDQGLQFWKPNHII